jgi:hypothetical protein
MKRIATLFAGFGVLSLTPLMLAQEMQSQPGPTLPSDIVGPQLIAWSQQQEPHRVPQPLPDQQRPSWPANPQAQPQPTVRNFTGRMRKDGSQYVFRVSSDTAYQLIEQQRARRYEGK